MEQTSHARALEIVLRNADSRHQQMDFTTFAQFTLADLGYDSLSVIELNMLVEQELDDLGKMVALDDDRWNMASLVTAVVADIEKMIDECRP